MEVTKKNFREVLAELENVIPSAAFLAIDGEFTGLQNTGQEVNAFDTPSQYYSKVRSSCVDFLLVQFGLCIFKYDEEKDKYTHRAYNFYIFPRPQSRSAPDPRFICQSSSIEFLASQGFDFNKLFTEGIPYLTQPEEQKMRENLEEKQKPESSNSTSTSNGEVIALIPIPEQHVSFIEDVCSQIEKFLESSDQEELQLDRCNAFLRKLIYQEVGQRFDSNQVFLESRVLDNKNRVLVITKTGSEEARKQKEKERMEKELQELEDAIGFSTVVKKISQSGKLVIGHNMMLDICHLIHQCCFPLPASYSEFKELIGCVFPKLLDTKYMSYSSIFKESISSNVLEHLHKTLLEKPFKWFTAEPEDVGVGYNSDSEKYHEAGYDAYITGLCFVAMANHIGSLQKPEKYPVLPSSPLLNPYINKLFLMRVQDSPYINLTGPDPELPRNHVFYISFPKEWKVSDITQLFSPFGAVFIAWINETSAFVALHKRDQATLVKKTLMQNSLCTLMTYAAYQELQDGKTKCTSGSDKSLCAECKSGSLKCSSSIFSKYRKRMIIDSDPEIPLKRSTSRMTDYTCSSRSIEVIPEEQEISDLQYEKETGSSSQDNSGPAADSGASNSKMSSGSSKATNRKKEFEESDAWG